MGADPERAKTELLESLTFEIKLANASLPREERRNASKLYHPMTLGELSQEIPIIEWTQYVNNVLTPEILQVSFSFYRDLNLSNTLILPLKYPQNVEPSSDWSPPTNRHLSSNKLPL